MQLTPVALRVLGSLVEKSLTTPGQYPLSVTALVTACNQRSARDPVMELQESEVQQGLRELRDHDLARTSPVRGRVPKHEHTLERQLDLDASAQTVLGVLILRGPQTVGEIRTRTERWHSFADLDAVQQVLDRLADHPFLPLVRELAREPGRRESRWTHLLGDPTATPAVDPGAPITVGTTTGASEPVAGRPPSPSPITRLDRLDQRVATLEERLAALTAQLGPLLDEPVDDQ